MTHEDEENFQKDENCHICDIDIRVRDHCHITGKKNRGSSHQNCNLNFQLTDKPVIFHKLKGCDNHFIMQRRLVK